MNKINLPFGTFDFTFSTKPYELIVYFDINYQIDFLALIGTEKMKCNTNNNVTFEGVSLVGFWTNDMPTSDMYAKLKFDKISK